MIVARPEAVNAQGDGVFTASTTLDDRFAAMRPLRYSQRSASIVLLETLKAAEPPVRSHRFPARSPVNQTSGCELPPSDPLGGFAQPGRCRPLPFQLLKPVPSSTSSYR